MATKWLLQVLLMMALAALICSPGLAQVERARPELQPGVGEVFVPPPPIPPAPEDFKALEQATQAQAQAAPITLETLEQLACQSNPTLTQARAQVQGELGRAIQAGLWPNPQLAYVGEQLGVRKSPTDDDSWGEFQGAIVQQKIILGRKLDLERTKFLHRAQTAEWVALAQQFRVLNDVRMHYFRALAHQELVGVQRELLKNAEDNLVTLREMYNLGQANRAELHRANAMLQQQRLVLLDAENAFRQAWEELTALVGVDLPLQPIAGPLEGSLEPIPWHSALTRLVEESPELQAARAKLRADEVKVKRNIVEVIPDLNVQGGWGHNDVEEEGVAVAAVEILDIPLWDWNQGAIRQAEADMVRQRGEIRRTELMLRRQLAITYREYLSALQHVQNYQQVVLPEKRKAYEVMLDSYGDDRAAWIDVLEFEREYFAARAIYIQNLMLWRQSEVLIVGYLLHQGLMAPDPLPQGHIGVMRFQ